MLDIGPVDEAARLAAVRRYDILDTPPDGSFDRITAVAASLFDVPIAIVSLVDHDRIWFKSHHGLDVAQIDRSPGLCSSAILQDGAMVLTDASTDVRALANPLVAGEFGLRFYVGAPLRTSDGHNLGTLCVIDRQARTVSEAQIAQLESLAAVVVDQMELRLSARRAVADLSGRVSEKEAALRRSEMMAKEIDHRVMNSLQLVSGVLTLQSRALGQSDASDQLALAAGRVSAVARVHRHMYLGDRIEHVGCEDYLRRLCADLSTLGTCDIAVDSVACELLTARIAPVGLIVNELVTNAVKHGARRIAVSMTRTETGDLALSVANDGEALLAGFEPAAGAGLGMKVVGALVQQLGGDLSYGPGEGSRGARFTVRFPDSDRTPTD